MTTAVTAVLIYVPVQYDLNVYTFLPDIRAQAVEGAYCLPGMNRAIKTCTVCFGPFLGLSQILYLLCYVFPVFVCDHI